VLGGERDAVVGHELDRVTIVDPHVIATSGSDRHPVLVASDRPDSAVDGTVFAITAAELAAADDYEVDDYTRVLVPLRSGRRAWAYAIALHLAPDIAARKRPEIAPVSAGAGFDLSAGPGALPPGYADRVHAAFPRLGAAPALRDAIVGQALAKPQKAPPFSLPGELVRERTGQQWPTWEQLTSAWGD
jgi:hypothetical protein